MKTNSIKFSSHHMIQEMDLASPAVRRLLESRLAVTPVRAPDVGATLLADSSEICHQNLLFLLFPEI